MAEGRKIFFECRNRSESTSGVVIDDLNSEIAVASCHRHAGTFSSTMNSLADMNLSLESLSVFVIKSLEHIASPLFNAGFSDFPFDNFGFITNTLAFVGLGLAKFTNLGSKLANRVLANA